MGRGCGMKEPKHEWCVFHHPGIYEHVPLYVSTTVSFKFQFYSCGERQRTLLATDISNTTTNMGRSSLFYYEICTTSAVVCLRLLLVVSYLYETQNTKHIQRRSRLQYYRLLVVISPSANKYKGPYYPADIIFIHTAVFQYFLSYYHTIVQYCTTN